MFPKIVGFSPKSSNFDRLFHYLHHPFLGENPLFFGVSTRMKIVATQERCSCNSLWRHIKDAVDNFVRDHWLVTTLRLVPGGIFSNRKSRWAVTKTLVNCCIEGIILPSYMGIERCSDVLFLGTSPEMNDHVFLWDFQWLDERCISYWFWFLFRGHSLVFVYVEEVGLTRWRLLLIWGIGKYWVNEDYIKNSWWYSGNAEEWLNIIGH